MKNEYLEKAIKAVREYKEACQYHDSDAKEYKAAKEACQELANNAGISYGRACQMVMEIL